MGRFNKREAAIPSSAFVAAISPVFSAHTRATLAGRNLTATDGMFRSYAGDPNVPWDALWAAADREEKATRKRDGFSVMAEYGGPLGVPPDSPWPVLGSLRR
jgi:hypothetical protein